MITEETRRRAEAINPRERKRLRRNVIMWEGRLQRVQDSLDYAKEIGDKEYAAQLEADVAECQTKLRKALDEVNAALGTDL